MKYLCENIGKSKELIRISWNALHILPGEAGSLLDFSCKTIVFNSIVVRISVNITS